MFVLYLGSRCSVPGAALDENDHVILSFEISQPLDERKIMVQIQSRIRLEFQMSPKIRTAHARCHLANPFSANNHSSIQLNPRSAAHFRRKSNSTRVHLFFFFFFQTSPLTTCHSVFRQAHGMIARHVIRSYVYAVHVDTRQACTCPCHRSSISPYFPRPISHPRTAVYVYNSDFNDPRDELACVKFQRHPRAVVFSLLSDAADATG